MEQENLTLESNLEYLSLNKIQRIGYKISHFFQSIPKKVEKSVTKIPQKARKKTHFVINLFRTISKAFTEGDIFTRLSLLFMGVGLIAKHQIIRGVLYLLFEIAFIFFMIFIGGNALSNLGTLGTLSQIEYKVLDEDGILDITMTAFVDNSFTILLYSVLSIIFIIIFAFLWYSQLKDSLNLQFKGQIGRRASDKETLRNVLDKSYDKTLLFLPIGGLFLFTVIPIIVMVLVAFTDYDYLHVTPTKLFDWVGFYNIEQVFSSASTNASSDFIRVFFQVLLWTLLWAALF